MTAKAYKYLALAALLVLAPANSAWAAEPLPADAVAQVDQRVIERSQYKHWKRIARKGGDPRAPERRLRRQVMSFLISGVWIALEAKQRDIRVTSREVRRRFRRQRRQAFESRREYRRFLRESGQTEKDLRYRVRLDLLSEKVRKDVVRGADGPRAQQRRLDRFVVRFRTRWRKRTVCARGYRVEECGSVATPG